MEPDAPLLTIVDLTASESGHAEFAELYRTVLRPAFSPEELGSAAEAWPGGGGEGLVLGAKHEGKWVGAAVTYYGSGPLGLLVYLAASPEHRGLGLGSRLMEELRRAWAESGVEFVLGEVHDPRVWEDSQDEHPTARIRFYARHGARVLTVPWVQPAASPEVGRVPGMLLLSLFQKDSHARTIPAAALRQWVVDYFRAEEDLRDPEADMQVAQILRRIGDAPVRLVDAEDFGQVELLGPLP